MAEQRKRSPDSRPARRRWSPWAVRRRRPRRTTDLKRDAVVRAAAREFNAARLPQHVTGRHRGRARRHQAHGLLLRREQGATPVRVLPRRPASRSARSSRAGRSGRPARRDRLREVVRDYAVAIASEYGWCMVRAARPGPRHRTRRADHSLKSEIDQGIRRLLREGVADGSIAVRPEDRRVCDGRRAQLDRALVSRRTSRSRPQKSRDAFVTFFGARPCAAQPLPATVAAPAPCAAHLALPKPDRLARAYLAVQEDRGDDSGDLRSRPPDSLEDVPHDRIHRHRSPPAALRSAASRASSRPSRHTSSVPSPPRAALADSGLSPGRDRRSHLRLRAAGRPGPGPRAAGGDRGRHRG